MKRLLAFAAFAAVAATLTGTADAARFKGVVVAKDAKRKALVTATAKGAVRTVRTRRYSSFNSLNSLLAGGAQKPVLLQIAHMIFEQDQAGPPAREIEPAENLKLVAFDIDGQQIEFRRRPSFDQNVVERPDRHLNDPFRFRSWGHPLAIERR